MAGSGVRLSLLLGMASLGFACSKDLIDAPTNKQSRDLSLNFFDNLMYRALRECGFKARVLKVLDKSASLLEVPNFMHKQYCVDLIVKSVSYKKIVKKLGKVSGYKVSKIDRPTVNNYVVVRVVKLPSISTTTYILFRLLYNNW